MSQLVCSNCGTIGTPKTVTKGSILIELICECPLCSHDRYRRVRFPRPDGTFYIQAPIYQCEGCSVLFGDKDVFMKLKGTIARSA